MGEPSEWDLIQRCRRGSTAAFEPLVVRYQGQALAIAESLLLDKDDAADAVQDAFVRAFRGLGKLAEGSSFGPWFRSIVRNLCLDRLRSPAHRNRMDLSDQTIDRVAWTEPTRERGIEQGQLAAVVKDALATLSKDHREILVMKEMEGLRYDEIASALNISGGTVASRLHHARAAMKRALEARGITGVGAP